MKDLQTVIENFYFHLFRNRGTHKLYNDLMELPIIQRYKIAIEGITRKHNVRVIHENNEEYKLDVIAHGG